MTMLYLLIIDVTLDDVFIKKLEEEVNFNGGVCRILGLLFKRQFNAGLPV